jgi:outer membrane protein assembly factor BamD
MNKFSTTKLSLSLILSVLLSGCFIFGEPTEFDETTGRSDLWILQQSENFAQNRDWARAIDYLERAEKRFPNSKLAPQIKLNLAYAYKGGFRPEDAVAMLNKFIRTYPNHPSQDYAYYLKGVVLFKDRGIINKLSMQDISDRDIAPLVRSFQALKELTLVFPDSKYAKDAITRMTYLMNKIAERELYVARYYMKRKAYVAALNRAKYVLETYRQSMHQEEALVISISAYDHLGIEDLKKDTERILEKNYPTSEFKKQKNTAPKRDWWRFWEALYR